MVCNDECDLTPEMNQCFISVLNKKQQPENIPLSNAHMNDKKKKTMYLCQRMSVRLASVNNLVIPV